MYAVTSEDLAIVRFHGRNADTWKKPGLTAADGQQVESVETVEVGDPWLCKSPVAAQQVDDQSAARCPGRIGRRAAHIGDDDDASARRMHAEPGATRQ